MNGIVENTQAQPSVEPGTGAAPVSDIALAGRLWRLSASRGEIVRGLPVIALAVASALTFVVAGGSAFFFRMHDPDAMTYHLCAACALALLAIPLWTLAAASARLVAATRDERLSSLRLMGASAPTLRWLVLLETGAQALVGIAFGLVGYLILIVPVGLIRFRGGPIGAGGLWLGVPALIGISLALLVLCLVSAARGLGRIEVTPLGVRQRSEAAHVGVLRVIIGVAVIIVVALAGKAAGKVVQDELGMIATAVVMVGVPLLMVNVIGPWVIKMFGRAQLRRAKDSVGLIAARTVLDDPKVVWRELGGIALTCYVAVVAGGVTAITSSVVQEGMRPEDRMLTDDMFTGVIITLVISFLTAAAYVALAQTAEILERRERYVSLDLLGMDAAVQDQARRRAVTSPLTFVMILSVGLGALTVAPIIGFATLGQPSALAVVAGALVVGVLIVLAALRLSGRTLQRVVDEGLVRAE